VPRVVQVVLAHPPTPLGNRFLHPILAAAEECGLTLCLETGGAFTGRNRGVNAIGVPSTRFEYELSWPSAAQAHLLSVVAEGVPERFPELRILLDGFGAAWLPSLLWGMDRAHDRETAPPRRTSRVAPSDELRALVRFTTARLELPADVHQLVGLLGLVGAERLLVFGSGADADGSGRDAVALLPDAWRERVLRTNADELYRRALVLA
jgi:predicted TIM-barrel fold metal-dependent hydrolase